MELFLELVAKIARITEPSDEHNVLAHKGQYYAIDSKGVLTSTLCPCIWSLIHATISSTGRKKKSRTCDLGPQKYEDRKDTDKFDGLPSKRKDASFDVDQVNGSTLRSNPEFDDVPAWISELLLPLLKLFRYSL